MRVIVRTQEGVLNTALWSFVAYVTTLSHKNIPVEISHESLPLTIWSAEDSISDTSKGRIVAPVPRYIYAQAAIAKFVIDHDERVHSVIDIPGVFYLHQKS